MGHLRWLRMEVAEVIPSASWARGHSARSCRACVRYKDLLSDYNIQKESTCAFALSDYNIQKESAALEAHVSLCVQKGLYASCCRFRVVIVPSFEAFRVRHWTSLASVLSNSIVVVTHCAFTFMFVKAFLFHWLV